MSLRSFPICLYREYACSYTIRPDRAMNLTLLYMYYIQGAMQLHYIGQRVYMHGYCSYRQLNLQQVIAEATEASSMILLLQLLLNYDICPLEIQCTCSYYNIIMLYKIGVVIHTCNHMAAGHGSSRVVNNLKVLYACSHYRFYWFQLGIVSFLGQWFTCGAHDGDALHDWLACW